MTIQGVADALDDVNAPLSVVYAPKVSSVSGLPSDVAGSCPRVSVLISQAGSGDGLDLYEDDDSSGASVTCIGVVIGLISAAQVHQSICWVKQFPTGITLPAFSDGTLYRDVDSALIESLQAQSDNGRLQDIAAFDIIVTYLPDSGVVTTDKIRNCQFKGNSRKWKEGDTGQEVELELVASHIEWNS